MVQQYKLNGYNIVLDGFVQIACCDSFNSAHIFYLPKSQKILICYKFLIIIP